MVKGKQLKKGAHKKTLMPHHFYMKYNHEAFHWWRVGFMPEQLEVKNKRMNSA